MIIKNSEYVTSSTTLAQCPNDMFSEVAFIGRSNVGKSSLINYLCSSAKLVKTSKNPGKTITINHFIIKTDNQTHVNKAKFYLVDLPGYGYAKKSGATRSFWGEFIGQYLTMRKELKLVFVLIDASIPTQKLDIEFLTWLIHKKVNYSIIFTKVDKVRLRELNTNIAHFQQKLKTLDKSPIKYHQYSNVSKLSKESLFENIEEYL